MQKCFRTTDIDEVGLTARHLTFFEMLGNFSLGEYFKDGAVDLAWEFVTEHLRYPEDKLWATVFAGDPELRLDRDEVAVRAWERVGVPAERIVDLPAHRQLLAGGPDRARAARARSSTSTAGPSTAATGPTARPAASATASSSSGTSSSWSSTSRADGALTPLPQQNIDTGAGVERNAAILQDVHSVYETDGFQTIMAWVESETGTRYGDSDEATKAHRVLADHGRGMTFLVADGVTPSNEGRGYILRRVIRRAVQHGSRIGLESPFLGRLADVVVEQLEPVYPELADHRSEIREVLSGEEERFAKTLERGERLFDEVAARGEIGSEDVVPAARHVRLPGRAHPRARARARDSRCTTRTSRASWTSSATRSRSAAGSGAGVERAAEFARDAGFETEFVGFEKTEVLTQLGAARGARRRDVPGEAPGVALLRRGRRAGDRRRLARARTARGPSSSSAYRFGEDQALVFQGEGFEAGDRVKAVVPWRVRFPTMANHTATHLLHQALREVLGDHVRQAGSAVRPDKLRFDFTHGQALTPEERGRVEEIVNERVFENLPVHAFLTPIDEAEAARRHRALRREVRRHRARGRDPGLLARALRRDARARDGRDRALRAPLGRLGRLGRPPHRGGHLRRGLRAPARPGARGGGASRRSSSRRERRASARRRPRPARASSTSGGTGRATSR